MALSFRTQPEQALASYRAVGFHVEDDLIPDDVIDEVMATAMSRPNARDGVFAPIPMPHRDHPTFLKMMRFKPVVDVVETILGGTASGLGGEFFYMKPGTPGFARHQDNAYVQAPPDMFLSVWIALTDVDGENGALTFYPGSHLLGALEIREIGRKLEPGQNPGAQAVECVLPDGPDGGQVMTMRRGSAAFFHSQLVHSSGENRSNRFRYSFLATYLRKGQPFRPGRAQARAEVELRS